MFNSMLLRQMAQKPPPRVIPSILPLLHRFIGPSLANQLKIVRETMRCLNSVWYPDPLSATSKSGIGVSYNLSKCSRWLGQKQNHLPFLDRPTTTWTCAGTTGSAASKSTLRTATFGKGVIDICDIVGVFTS